MAVAIQLVLLAGAIGVTRDAFRQALPWFAAGPSVSRSGARGTLMPPVSATPAWAGGPPSTPTADAPALAPPCMWHLDEYGQPWINLTTVPFPPPSNWTSLLGCLDGITPAMQNCAGCANWPDGNRTKVGWNPPLSPCGAAPCRPTLCGSCSG